MHRPSCATHGQGGPDIRNLDATESAKASALPLQRLPSFGREEEREQVLAHLERDPLVSIIGLGGAGKTHFAIMLAHRWQQAREAPLTWVALANLDDEHLVSRTVCAAGGVRVGARENPLEALSRHFHDRAALLVLDNCEHLLDAVAELVAELTARCPLLRVLATSREVLDVPGETVWRLEPLALPDLDGDGETELERLQVVPAVALFLDRARRARPDFRLDSVNAAQVRRVVNRLEGIPLALELAAAQLRSVSLTTLENRLAKGLGQLRGPRHGVPERHLSMHAALAGSVAALEPLQRQLFYALAVFHGGFSLEAVNVVCSSQEESDLLPQLMVLIDKSLVIAGTGGTRDRYRLLEPVRQFATERLGREANRRESLELAHMAYFRDWMEPYRGALRGPGRTEALALLEAELPNIRQAWHIAMQGKDFASLDGMACSLVLYWNFSDRFEEGRSLCELALTAAGATEPAPGWLAYAAALLAWIRADLKTASRWLAQADAAAQVADDPLLTGSYLRQRAGVALGEERLEDALSDADRSIAILSDAQCRWDAALAMAMAADIRENLGRHEEAIRIRERALGEFEALGDPWGKSVALLGLAIGLARQSLWSRARRAAHESLALQQQSGDAWNIAQCRVLSGEIEQALGNHDLARDHFKQALLQLRLVGDRLIVAYLLARLVVSERTLGRSQQAARLLGIRAATWLDCDAPYPYVIHGADLAPVETSLRQALGDAEFDAQWARGRALSHAEALEWILGDEHEKRSHSAMEAGLPILRVQLLGKATVWRDGQPLSATDWGYALPRELMYYLLLNGPTSKERLGVELWPEASSSQLRGRFRSTLYQLRKALGDASWIRYSEGRYAFDLEAPVQVDAHEFEALTQQGLAYRDSDPDRSLGLLRQAVALWKGDVLEGETPGDWFMGHEQRLRDRLLEATLAAVRLMLDREDHARASELMRQATAIHPLDERLGRARATALWRLGDRASALAELDRLAALLQQELDADPEAETQALRRRIAQGH